jgi:hypothetical protein
MAKFADNSVMDAALAKIATATRLTVTSAQPANFAGIAAVALADVAVDGGDFSAPFDGTPNGRSMTVTAQSGIPVDASADATHICLDDGVTLLYVTTCPSQALVEGNTVSPGAWTVNFADPV